MYTIKVYINLDTGGYETYHEEAETKEDAKRRVGGLDSQLDLAMSKGTVTKLYKADGLGTLIIAGSKIASFRITAKEKKVKAPKDTMTTRLPKSSS